MTPQTWTFWEGSLAFVKGAMRETWRARLLSAEYTTHGRQLVRAERASGDALGARRPVSLICLPAVKCRGLLIRFDAKRGHKGDHRAPRGRSRNVAGEFEEVSEHQLVNWLASPTGFEPVFWP